MITIEQIKEALRQHIAEAEAATPSPWMCLHQGEQEHPGIEAGNMPVVIMGWRDVDTDDGGVRGNTDDEALANATFIAHARTMSPAACKCLLLAIEWLEELIVPCACLADSTQFSEGYENGWLRASHEANACLESIRQEWHNQTK